MLHITPLKLLVNSICSMISLVCVEGEHSFMLSEALYTTAMPSPLFPFCQGLDRILYPGGGISLYLRSLSSLLSHVSVIAHIVVFLS